MATTSALWIVIGGAILILSPLDPTGLITALGGITLIAGIVAAVQE